jgi:urease alpha subunit
MFTIHQHRAAPQMGDANGSIPTVQPIFGRPMWGAQPAAAALNSFNFVSKASIDKGELGRLCRSCSLLS